MQLSKVLIYGGIAVVVVGVSFVVTLGTLPAVAVCVVLGLVIASLLHRDALLVALVAIGIVTLRPNIWGEVGSPVGAGALAFAALIVFTRSNGLLKITAPKNKLLRVTLIWVGLAYAWELARVAIWHPDTDVSTLITGAMLMVVSIGSIGVIASDSHGARLLAKTFVGLVGALCISYTITAVVWVAMGPGALGLGSIYGGTGASVVPTYFPFTTTWSSLDVFGTSVPRFTGIGREPGWMALYAGIAFLLFPYTGWKSRIVRYSMLVGLLGTISTAGFAVFAVSIALSIMVNARGRTQFGRTVQRIFGAGLVAAGTWAAFFAPVVGLAAKEEQNAVSLSERTIATQAGLDALSINAFSGGLQADVVGGINLVAAIAANGIPYVLAITLAVLAPLRLHPNRKAAIPILAAIFVTLLASQPAKDSVWVFCLVVIVAAATRAPSLPIKGARKRVLTAKPRLAVPGNYRQTSR